jgi:hypothetical protein
VFINIVVDIDVDAIYDKLIDWLYVAILDKTHAAGYIQRVAGT